MGRLFQLKANTFPKGMAIKWRVSNALVWMARKVKPDNPEVQAYVAEKAIDSYMETMITGESATCPQCMQKIERRR